MLVIRFCCGEFEAWLLLIVVADDIVSRLEQIAVAGISDYSSNMSR